MRAAWFRRTLVFFCANLVEVLDFLDDEREVSARSPRLRDALRNSKPAAFLSRVLPTPRGVAATCPNGNNANMTVTALFSLSKVVPVWEGRSAGNRPAARTIVRTGPPGIRPVWLSP